MMPSDKPDWERFIDYSKTTKPFKKGINEAYLKDDVWGAIKKSAVNESIMGKRGNRYIPLKENVNQYIVMKTRKEGIEKSVLYLIIYPTEDAIHFIQIRNGVIFSYQIYSDNTASTMNEGRGWAGFPSSRWGILSSYASLFINWDTNPLSSRK